MVFVGTMKGELDDDDTWQPLSLVTRRLLLRLDRRDTHFATRGLTKDHPQNKKRVEIEPDEQQQFLERGHGSTVDV